MRIVFAGSGSFGLPALRALVEGGQEIVLVVTQPDRPSGRGQTVHAGQVKRFAADEGIRLLQPEDINARGPVRSIRAVEPDLLLVIAFGQKIGPSLLAAPRYGAVNLHASLLPKYRGAAPINWALIHGEAETGLTVIEITDRMDAGDILGQRATPVGPDETAGELADRLALLGARLVTEVVRELALGDVERRTQNEAQVKIAPRLKKTDGLVDWNQPAADVHNLIRGTTPCPGAYTWWQRKAGPEPLRLILAKTRLLEGVASAGCYAGGAEPGVVLAAGREGVDVAAACGAVRILSLTPAGKRTMSAADFVNGYGIEAGARFASAREGAS
jgi:methionyl-tRNA formyltransferase